MLCLATWPVAAERAFAPRSGWELTPFGPDGAACVAKAEMDNGFILAFTGPRSGPVERLSVDFRQPIFTPRQAYTARLSAPGVQPGGYAAQAAAPSVLALSLQGQASAVAAIREAERAMLDVEGNAFTFDLSGLNAALDGFETCGVVPPTPAPVAAVREAPAPAPVPEPRPEPKREPIVVDFTDIAPEPAPKPVGAGKVAALERDNEALAGRLALMERELTAARAELAARPKGVGGADWTLEEMAARYEESERQAKRLGEKLARERLACAREKEEIEALLFDPVVAEQRQIAQLADLERQLAAVREEAARERARYEAKILMMEKQLRETP
jgi:hypothetical protein